MRKNPKERNSVNVFSDYGLDERQKQYASQLGFKSFKALYYGVIALTMIWCVVWVSEIGVPLIYTALSYLLLAGAVTSVYEIKAAKNGIINGISAFSMSLPGRLIWGIVVLGLWLIWAIMRGDRDFIIVMSILFAAGVISSIIEYFCGKKNFEVLDKVDEEDEEVDE